jgi:hypothetical protein
VDLVIFNACQSQIELVELLASFLLCKKQRPSCIYPCLHKGETNRSVSTKLREPYVSQSDLLNWDKVFLD